MKEEDEDEEMEKEEEMEEEGEDEVEDAIYSWTELTLRGRKSRRCLREPRSWGCGLSSVVEGPTCILDWWGQSRIRRI